jgi:hypothetical protein
MKELFEQQFKFRMNERVRHKGDTHKYDADMGLLIIQRELVEQLNSDGESCFERYYVCRMIRWSGSGDLGRFKETEIMNVEDYNNLKIQEDSDRDDMRRQGRMIEKEIFEIFGVNKEDYLYEVINGTPDTTKKFRVTGFKNDDKGVAIYATESLFTAQSRTGEGKKIEAEKREWFSKSQFQKVND